MPTPVQPTSRYSPALAHKISQASPPTPPSRWRTYLPTYLPWRPASSQKDAVHNRLCGTEAVARLGQRLGELFLRVACWGLASKCRSMNDTGGASAEGSIGRSSDIWVSFGVTHSGLTVVCAGIHSSFCKVHGNGWKGLLEGVQSAGEARVDLVEAYTDCVHWLMKDHGVRRLRRRGSLTVGLPAAANVEPRTAPVALVAAFSPSLLKVGAFTANAMFARAILHWSSLQSPALLPCLSGEEGCLTGRQAVADSFGHFAQAQRAVV